jgi:ferrous iron transport protein B
MPIVGLIAAALFGNSSWVATAAYFIGVAAVVVSGLILKKTKPFAGEPAPFVMELPAYHAPVPTNILRTTWERGWSFIKRAGTVILAASMIIWTLNSLSFQNGFHYITAENGGASILENIGMAIAWLFKPLGFGNWQAAVATVLGLVAKEEVVGVFGSLSEMLPEAAVLMTEIEGGGFRNAVIIGREFFGGSQLAAFSFMIFNLLCAPCFAAMGAIRREMNNWKWSLGAIVYMTVFAYAVSFVVYQLGGWFTASGGNAFGTAIAIAVVAVMVWMLVRPNKYGKKNIKSGSVK